MGEGCGFCLITKSSHWLAIAIAVGIAGGEIFARYYLGLGTPPLSIAHEQIDLINGHKIQGWTPIILSILFVGGVQIMMIGVLGEYLWRVLAQVRGAPPYIIEETLESAKS